MTIVEPRTGGRKVRKSPSPEGEQCCSRSGEGDFRTLTLSAMGDSLTLARSDFSFPSLSLLPPDFLTKTGEAVDVPATVGRAVGRRTRSDGFVEFLLVALAIVFLPACPCLSSIVRFYSPHTILVTSSREQMVLLSSRILLTRILQGFYSPHTILVTSSLPTHKKKRKKRIFFFKDSTVCSIPSHRHSYIGFIFSSRFIDS
jgi:hypothetical protein